MDVSDAAAEVPLDWSKTDMIYNNLGRSGLKVSALSLGAWVTERYNANTRLKYWPQSTVVFSLICVADVVETVALLWHISHQPTEQEIDADAEDSNSSTSVRMAAHTRASYLPALGQLLQLWKGGGFFQYCAANCWIFGWGLHCVKDVIFAINATKEADED